MLDKYLVGHYQSKLVMQKLVRALGMLLKIRYHVQEAELKHIYYTIFQSHLRYGCQVWYQSNSKSMREKIEILQKRALRIMSFSDPCELSSPLFKEWKILKIKDVQNCSFFIHSWQENYLNCLKISFKNVAIYPSILQGSVVLNVYSCHLLNVNV